MSSNKFPVHVPASHIVQFWTFHFFSFINCFMRKELCSNASRPKKGHYLLALRDLIHIWNTLWSTPSPQKNWDNIYSQDSAPPTTTTPTMSFSWQHSRSSLNLNLQQPPHQQNTIVSIPSNQNSLAPSPNYLKYSKVWETKSQQKENCQDKDRCGAKCIFTSL